MSAKSSCKYTLLEEKTIFSGGWYPNAFFSNDGTIIVGLRYGKERITIYSPDKGSTWLKNDLHIMDTFYTGLSDGSIYGIKMLNVIQDNIRREQEYKPFIAWIRRGKTSEDLLKGQYDDDFVKADIPDLAGTDGDAENFCLESLIMA